MELRYKAINMSHFLFAEEPVILVTQAQQVFYLDDPKNGSNWKVMQVIWNKRIWDMPKMDNIDNEQLNVLEIVVDHQVDEHMRMTFSAGLTLILQ